MPFPTKDVAVDEESGVVFTVGHTYGEVVKGGWGGYLWAEGERDSFGDFIAFALHPNGTTVWEYQDNGGCHISEPIATPQACYYRETLSNVVLRSRYCILLGVYLFAALLAVRTFLAERIPLPYRQEGNQSRDFGWNIVSAR